jgi:hypothetical protein
LGRVEWMAKPMEPLKHQSIPNRIGTISE